MTTTSQPVQQTSPGREFLGIDEMAASSLTVLNEKDITQYPKVIKWAIQKYIEACLSKEGQFRKFFEHFATYTVDYIVNENLSKDTSRREEQLSERFKRHIQVSRFFDDMAERPPQIFIQDGGYSYHPSSLGSFSEGKNLQDDLGSHYVRATEDVTVPITITCAALDEQIVSDLAAFLSAIFGSLGMPWTCNYLLKPAPNDKGIYWEVKIPLKHEVSAKSHSPLHGDPRSQIWSLTFSMDVWFENSTFIYYRNDPRYQATTLSSSLVFPSKIKVGTTVPISFIMEPAMSDVVSSNRNIALIYKSGTRYLCKARKLGTFTLQVMKTTAESSSSMDVVLEQEVEVVVR